MSIKIIIKNDKYHITDRCMFI